MNWSVFGWVFGGGFIMCLAFVEYCIGMTFARLHGGAAKAGVCFIFAIFLFVFGLAMICGGIA